MTDEELVARSLTQAKLNGAILCGVESWEGSRRTEHVPLLTVDYDALSSAVVAALREAGRLLPEGCVAIERGQIDRMRGVVRWADRSIRNLPQTGESISIQPEDLEPTP